MPQPSLYGRAATLLALLAHRPQIEPRLRWRADTYEAIRTLTALGYADLTLSWRIRRLVCEITPAGRERIKQDADRGWRVQFTP